MASEERFSGCSGHLRRWNMVKWFHWLYQQNKPKCIYQNEIKYCFDIVL